MKVKRRGRGGVFGVSSYNYANWHNLNFKRQVIFHEIFFTFPSDVCSSYVNGMCIVYFLNIGLVSFLRCFSSILIFSFAYLFTCFIDLPVKYLVLGVLQGLSTSLRVRKIINPLTCDFGTL